MAEGKKPAASSKGSADGRWQFSPHRKTRTFPATSNPEKLKTATTSLF
jgi:hypothetical protein